MEQTVAASSPAEVDVFRGEQPTFDEFSRYRQRGEIPARFKPAEPAESAPADAPEQTVDDPESVPDSDPEEAQEQPAKGSGAERRIKQLLARVKELERSQQPAAKPDAHSGPSPAPAMQQPAHQQYTRPKPTAEDKNQDGSAKYGTYEDFVEELADWKAEQRWVGAQREAAAQASARALAEKAEEAHTRFGDAFNASRDAFTKATMGPQGEPMIPIGVLAMVSDSDMLMDLVHTIGSDPESLAKFVQVARTNPRQAIRYIAEVENKIEAEREKPESEIPSKKAPEKKKTNAPPPPSPVGGASSRGFDVSDESLSADEWARKRNAQLARRHS